MKLNFVKKKLISIPENRSMDDEIIISGPFKFLEHEERLMNNYLKSLIVSSIIPKISEYSDPSVVKINIFPITGFIDNQEHNIVALLIEIYIMSVMIILPINKKIINIRIQSYLSDYKNKITKFSKNYIKIIDL